MDIKIGDRTIPMILTVCEMAEIQEAIGCTVAQLRDEVFGLKHNLETDEYTFGIMDDKDKIRKFGKLLRILGNAGLEEAGQAPDLTDKWILRRIKPGMLMPYVIAATAVISEAMDTEADKTQSGPVDEVLAEENRKKEPGSSPTGESAPADSSPG
jgi:hypothetical protein